VSKKKATVPSAVAKLAPVTSPRIGHLLVALTNEQLGKIQQAPDWANQPPIQTLVKSLLGETAGLDQTLTALANARALVTSLETTRDTQIVTILRDRRNLEGAITTVCKGDPSAVKAWGCQLKAKTLASASTEAPVGLKAKASKSVAGTVTVRCTAIHGAVYLWVMSDSAAAPAAGVQPVITTKARLDVSGQQVGHTLYFRVAVIRRNGGQSLWSDPVQVVVR
jgi:hypothetical protein